MPVQGCPNCKKAIDMDSFAMFSPNMLFYCECGRVYGMKDIFHLTEIPKDEVDLSGLEGQYPKPASEFSNYASRGLFIRKERWKPAADSKNNLVPEPNAEELKM